MSQYSPLLIIGNLIGLLVIIILAYVVIYRRPRRLLKTIIFSVIIYAMPVLFFNVRGETTHNYRSLMWLTSIGGWIVVWGFYLASLGKSDVTDDKISQGFRDFFRS